MAVEVKIPNGPLYVDMDGFRICNGFSLEEFRSALRYQAQPHDNFLVTFPKAGTTWAIYISYLIVHKGVPPQTLCDFSTFGPFLECGGSKALQDMKPSGIIKSHLPRRLIPYHPEAKYIYVCRNPKDVCVSFYYHTLEYPFYEFPDGKLDVFFDVFMNGENDHGDYFDHLLSWYAHRDDPNVLFIHYEDMKANTKDAVLKIAEFLDTKYHRMLLEHEGVLQSVVMASEFKAMKVHMENLSKDFFLNPLDADDIPEWLRIWHEMYRGPGNNANLMRMGVVGDWKVHLTAEMNAKMEAKILLKLSGTDIVDVWRKHGVFDDLH